VLIRILTKGLDILFLPVFLVATRQKQADSLAFDFAEH